MTHSMESDSQHGHSRPYLLLALSLGLSLIVMYFLTFSMINAWGDFYLNVSNLYMALMMVFPMGIIMLALMWRMFPRRALNIGLIVVFALAFVAAFLLGRSSAFIGDRGFLDSMIPHHSRAILVCEGSSITDPEIESLCGEIEQSQQREIDQMKRIMARLS